MLGFANAGTFSFAPSALGPVNRRVLLLRLPGALVRVGTSFTVGILPAADFSDDWGRADRDGLSAGLQAEFDLPQPGLAHGHRTTQTGGCSSSPR